MNAPEQPWGGSPHAKHTNAYSLLPPLDTKGEFLESVVVSGVGLFNWSAFSGLQWGPAWADHATAAELFQEGLGGSGVVAGIRMDCDRFG